MTRHYLLILQKPFYFLQNIPELNDSDLKWWTVLHCCFTNAAWAFYHILRQMQEDHFTTMTKRPLHKRAGTFPEHVWLQRLNYHPTPITGAAAVWLRLAAVKRYSDYTLIIELTLLLTCWHPSCLRPAPTTTPSAKLQADPDNIYPLLHTSLLSNIWPFF